MPVSYLAYNTGSTLPNTIQYGSIAIFTGGTSLPAGVRWWPGPPEENGYVICTTNPAGNQPNPNNEAAYLSFLGTLNFSEQDFITLTQTLIGGSYANGNAAKTALETAGLWTSFTGAAINYIILGSNREGTFAIEDGIVWSWGNGADGLLGNNSVANRSTPVSVCGTRKTFCKIGTGTTGASMLAIDKYGQAWGWGYNGYVGVLGNNSLVNQSTPVSVCGAKKTFCHIDVNNVYGFAFALDKYGQAWGWGYASRGALGDNSTVKKSTPVSVCGTKKTFCKITAGGDRHNSAIDKYGSVWSWGVNSSGELGTNSITSRCTPVNICGTKKTFCEIVNGRRHTLSIDKYGQIWGWGYNQLGRLGNNSTVQVSTPVSVCGVKKTFCKVSTGYEHSLAIDKYGKVWAWGGNTIGELGINSLVDKSTPVLIYGNKTFCEILAAYGTSFAVDKNNVVWGWGYNYKGQLGDNSTSDKSTPVRICGF